MLPACEAVRSRVERIGDGDELVGSIERHLRAHERLEKCEVDQCLVEEQKVGWLGAPHVRRLVVEDLARVRLQHAQRPRCDGEQHCMHRPSRPAAKVPSAAVHGHLRPATHVVQPDRRGAHDLRHMVTVQQRVRVGQNDRVRVEQEHAVAQAWQA